MPKGDYPAPVIPLLPEVTIPGEACLNLNVWTPDTAAPTLAVFVWIHGGSFTQGSGANAEYDGTAFARDGVICVTINYRLGAEGFLELADADSNRALCDMVAALTWVRDNIAGFGGDPARVTLAGESAGAMAVAALIAVPAARGLFARAVLQSGAASNVLSASQAAFVAARLAAMVGTAPTRAAVAPVPVERLVAAVGDVGRDARAPGAAAEWGDIVRLMPFAPIVAPSMPSMPSTTRCSRTSPRPTGSPTSPPFPARRPPRSCWRSTPTPGPPRPAAQLVEARGEMPTWTYCFDGLALDDNGGLGSCHTAEVLFVFKTAHLPELRLRVGARPSPAVTQTMHSTWVRFATTGSRAGDRAPQLTSAPPSARPPSAVPTAYGTKPPTDCACRVRHESPR